MTGPPVGVVILSLAAACGAFAGSPGTARAERKKVAVLEYRAGVVQEKNLATRLADRLKRTAALTVIDPAEARRRLSRVDAEVGRCSGNAVCLAQLGARLNVDEVLLVGISQLGDVVLALERIDVEEAAVGPHLAETLGAGEEPDDDKLLAWLKQLYPPDVFKRYGFLTVQANIGGAKLMLNGQPHGTTPVADKLRLAAPKPYTVELIKAGYLTFSARIDLLPDATVEVRAELSPEMGPLAWYKRWYLWAIVGGVVAAGAVGGAIYATTRPDTAHSTGIITW